MWGIVRGDLGDIIPPHFYAIYNEYEIVVNIDDVKTYEKTLFERMDAAFGGIYDFLRFICCWKYHSWCV